MLEAAVSQAHGDLEEIIKLKPGFDIYTTIERQVDRFANIGLRLAESQRQDKVSLDQKSPARRSLTVQRRRIPKT
jgi:hypothetical protein